jgi:hypothetical protein
LAETGFNRHGENEYQAKFSESEREVLINLTEQIIELLAERADHGHEDPLAAMVGITSAEFRRYTESTLRDKKRAHSMAMRSNLINAGDDPIDLDHDGAMAWLGGLNDIRLALGVRLKIEDNNQEHLELLKPDDPLRAVYAVYTWLGWLQESLISALMDDAS